MVKGKLVIAFIIFECIVLLVLYLQGSAMQQSARVGSLQAKRELVIQLGLTDFALWTEARYTRHPSQTDLFSAFQDFPGSFDHFPAGSIIAPSHVPSGETQ
jgi:hypothetical protein